MTSSLRTAWRIAWRTLAVVLVFLMVVGIFERSWVRAQWNAAITLAYASGNGAAMSLAGHVSRVPRHTEEVIDGIPTSVYTPSGGGDHPAVLFITGADKRGRLHPDVVRLGTGLARAGYLTFVPDLPGLKTGTVQPSVVPLTANLVHVISERATVRHHHVGLASVSTGASLALLVAERPEAQGDVSAVAGVAPFADVRTLVRSATTGTYVQADGTVVSTTQYRFLQRSVVRSVFTLLPSTGPRGAVVAQLRRRALDAEDPIDELRTMSRGPLVRILSPASRALIALAGNEDPKRFDSLWAALPDRVRSKLAMLSPITHAGRLTMPIELASAPHDKYFPLGESRAIVDAAPHGRAHLTVTKALDHAELALHPSDVRDVLRLDGFLVRWLRDLGRS